MKSLHLLAITLAGTALLGASITGSQLHFATKAASGGIAEVQLGQLALKNAYGSDVKSFAKRMIDDHTKINDQLKGLAAKDNITLPTSMDAKDQATYDHLSTLTGNAFDRAYMRDMVADHEKDIAAFQKEANEGTNPDLKSFASSTLPTLQEHLKLAKHAQSEIMTTSSR